MSEDGNIFGTISGVNWWLQTTRLVVVCEEQEISSLQGDMGGGGGGEGRQGGAEALDAPGQHHHCNIPDTFVGDEMNGCQSSSVKKKHGR